VRVLGAGRHVRWGRFFSTCLQDLRKAALLVAGQDVLTADNVGLKLSLIVSYQVTTRPRLRTKRRTGRATSTTLPSSRCARS